MLKFFVSLVCVFVLCPSSSTWANGLSVRILSINQGPNFTLKVDCEVVWQNSWSESSNAPNHDAVWLFSKQKEISSFGYLHSKIESASSSDFQIHISNDSLGLMLESNASLLSKESRGIVSVVFSKKPIQVNFYVGGIEMVFVPEGTFFLGDAVSNHSFESFLKDPLKIESENQLKFGDNLSSSTFNSVVGDVPTKFPKGFNAFYCMKYEISQQQFAEFLSGLSYVEQKIIFDPNANLKLGSNPLVTGSNTYFNGLSFSEIGFEPINKPFKIECDLNKNGVFNETTDGMTLACNYLSWFQVLSYLDWVGLRPMTEFEFEKACRGFGSSVSKEFAFGTDKVTDANILTNDSTELETNASIALVAAGIASHGYFGRSGPLRCGFAATSSTQKLTAGASYWGIMELSGNLWEQTMGVNKQNGLLFSDSYGDGFVNSFPADWKTESCMLRGGAWFSGIGPTYRDLAVSDRYYYNLASEIARNTSGGRGVRSLKSFTYDK